MAYSVIDTHIQNPGKKKRAASVAKRKLTPKQIKAGFGGKRRQMNASRRRHHKARPNAAPKRRKRAAVARHTRSHRPRTVKRSQSKRNPAEIIAWTLGNPARRGKKMATKKHKRKAVARHYTRNAGSRKHVYHRKHRRGNPAGMKPMDLVIGGVAGLGGAVASRALPQLVLGSNNTGVFGYAANAIASLVLAAGTHAVAGRKFPMLGAWVGVGGFIALAQRVITDQTPFGSAVALSGLGDWGLGLYQKSNFPYPPRVANGRGPGSSMFTWGDGSQAVATVAAGGSDSLSAC